MKLRLRLVALCFVLFYLFTDLNSEISGHLSGREMYSSLLSKHGFILKWSSIVSFLTDAILGYLTLYEFYYRRRRKSLSIVLYLLAAIPCMILFRYLLQEVALYQLWGYHNYSQSMRAPLRYFMDNISFALYYSSFGVVFFFIRFSAYTQRAQQELLLQNRNAELSSLRSQVNPHFLFNSLNNIYTMVYQGSANALTAIGGLAELMRYMLYEKAEKVPLQKEVQYLQRLVDLQLLRYDFKPAVKINFQNVDEQLTIAPLILVPFVENAFKHGDLRDAEMPLIVDVKVEDGIVHLFVQNKKGNFVKDAIGGIGLGNVRKRLALIYPNHYLLDINDAPESYTVKLSLTLND